MLNKQPPEHRDHSSPDSLEIVDVWKTIQGEGPFAGRPATFIRLAGCNFQCPACDTNYTTGRRFELVEDLLELTGGADLVVLTGGEPLRQDITRLVDLLIDRGTQVQIETNGILHLPGLHSRAVVVCSPKTPGIARERWPYAFKYVLQAGQVDTDGLPLTALGGMRPARPPEDFPRSEIYLQPLDEQDPEANKRNVDATVQSCMQYGYRLCLQMQKIVGLK